MLHTYFQLWPTLTAGEIKVAKLIYLGYSNEAIAQELNISMANVKTHVQTFGQNIGQGIGKITGSP